ncbi:hypothetical protein ACA910_012472 [Epithemia clementina (nom. ined.)]
MVDQSEPLSASGEDQYRCLVVDAGPIIKLTGVSALWKRAQSFCTVPGVVQEIRDAKARHHLDNLPFDITIKEPSGEAIKAVIDFARQTGDYQSLSSVDIQVLALVYDLEKEGCHGDVSHLRKKPKRKVGVGKLQLLAGAGNKSALDAELAHVSENPADGGDCDENDSDSEGSSSDHISQAPVPVEGKKETTERAKPSCWAALLDPNCVPLSNEQDDGPVNAPVVSVAGQHKVPTDKDQFDDADEGEATPSNNDKTAETRNDRNDQERTVEEELKLDFPSLAAASTVLYDDFGERDDQIDEEERKKRSLQPISKSGKIYISVPVVKHLAKQKVKPDKCSKSEATSNEFVGEPSLSMNDSPDDVIDDKPKQSRIMGGMAFAGQEDDVEDDGEGWISTASEIRSLKAKGALTPAKGNVGAAIGHIEPVGPPISQRTACTTTDFAMQNVILQMNMELLSVDGMKIKKVKSWVRRCGACFKIYADSEDTGPISGKRLFCEKCGSDMMQRIACSVNGKTGRLRLHLKKNYRHNLRGTKFSLPKPGSGDRFKGDLLLREDQLLTGTWGQKAKMSGGGKARAASESIFGRDIAKNVGCHVNAISADEIQVGFGRRNPNAAKGRERRGKKKKSASRACGLRRY